MDFFDRFAVPHPSPAIYASMVAIGLNYALRLLSELPILKNGAIYGVNG